MVNRPGRTMMSDRRPNNRGVMIGRVVKLHKGENKATVKLEKKVSIGDGLEFWVKVGGRVGTTITKMMQNGSEVTSALPGTQVVIDIPNGVRMNDRVFRTFDAELMEYAGRFYGDKAKRRIPVDAVVTAKIGQPLTVLLTDDEGNTGFGETNFITEAARKHALDEAAVRKQIDRLGTTEYALNSLTVELDEGVMVPMSEINEARRMAAEALDAARLEAFAPKRMEKHKVDVQLVKPEKKVPKKHALLTVRVDTVSKAQAALAAGADYVIFGGDLFSTKIITDADYEEVARLARQYGKKWAAGTPRIISQGQEAFYAKQFAKWQNLNPDAVYINNNSLWQLAKENCSLPLWADMALNIYNSQCLDFWHGQGAKGAVLSAELTMKQIEHLCAVSPMPLECLVQGRIEMMVSEYCADGSFLGDLHKGKCSFNCREQLFLNDRKDASFPLVTDQNCRMHVLNAHDLSLLANLKTIQDAGVERLLIDARYYSDEETGKIAAMYKGVINGELVQEENLPQTTRGHYFRGVL